MKEGEELIGRRVYGDTDIFSKPKNFNYELRRSNEERQRFKFVKWMIVASFIPIGYVLLNAEYTLRKTKVKERSSARRERLDEEFGVDREQMTQNFEKLDEIYRISCIKSF